MLVMLRSDLLNHTPSGADLKKSETATLKAELSKRPLEPYTLVELIEVC